MARSTWSLLIGMLSAFMYTCLTLFNIVYLLYISGYIELHETDDNSDVTDENRENFESFYSTTNIYIIVFESIAYVAMIAASVFLQVGVKRESPQLLSPWLCLSGVIIALGAVGLVFSQSYSDVEAILDVFLCLLVLQSAMWYPIFAHYKEMRQNERFHLENCHMQRNGAAYYIGHTSDSVYSPTTEFVNSSWSDTLSQQFH